MADFRYVIWCCINLRPQQMRYDDGFKLFVGILSPEYVDSTMSTTTFDKTLDTLYDRVKKLSWTACGRYERNACAWGIQELSLVPSWISRQRPVRRVSPSPCLTWRRVALLLPATCLRRERFPAPTPPKTSDPGSRRWVFFFQLFAVSVVSCCFCYFGVILYLLERFSQVGRRRLTFCGENIRETCPLLHVLVFLYIHLFVFW